MSPKIQPSMSQAADKPLTYVKIIKFFNKPYEHISTIICGK